MEGGRVRDPPDLAADDLERERLRRRPAPPYRELVRQLNTAEDSHIPIDYVEFADRFPDRNNEDYRRELRDGYPAFFDAWGRYGRPIRQLSIRRGCCVELLTRLFDDAAQRPLEFLEMPELSAFRVGPTITTKAFVGFLNSSQTLTKLHFRLHLSPLCQGPILGALRGNSNLRTLRIDLPPPPPRRDGYKASIVSDIISIIQYNTSITTFGISAYLDHPLSYEQFEDCLSCWNHTLLNFQLQTHRFNARRVADRVNVPKPASIRFLLDRNSEIRALRANVRNGEPYVVGSNRTIDSMLSLRSASPPYESPSPDVVYLLLRGNPAHYLVERSKIRDAVCDGGDIVDRVGGTGVATVAAASENEANEQEGREDVKEQEEEEGEDRKPKAKKQKMESSS